MFDLDVFEKEFKKGIMQNSYIFFGMDEKIIKDTIDSVVDKFVDPGFQQLNLVKFDGNKVDMEQVVNACETMPFMSEKKVVVIYRASFLADKDDRDSKIRFERLREYLKNVPEHCILLVYYVFQDHREKPSNNVKKLEKLSALVKVENLKGERLYRKVETLFNEREKQIDRALLRFFCEKIPNNIDMIINEVNKLVDYTMDRDITREDILNLMPAISDDDIFDLVDFVSQKKTERALEVLNELIFKGESITSILFMIVRQFKLIYNIKGALNENKTKDIIAKELRLHPYVCEKLIFQSRKFTLNQIKECLKLCRDTEIILKSSPSDKTIEMEMLLVNTVLVSK